MKNSGIDEKSVTKNFARPQIVVEVGQAHEGSESLAHAYVEEVANSGADAIKFQLHIAEEESSIDEIFRENKRYQRESRFEYWKRHELSPGMMADLIDHAQKRGLRIGFSTFSVEGLARIRKSEADFLKIGSGEAVQHWFLRAAAQIDLPIILSTGLSRMSEIGEAVRLFRSSNRSITLLQCTTMYPSPLEEVGINILDELRQRFFVDVGLSDHSGQLGPSVFALAKGVSMVEVHGTFSKKTQGPDSTASLDFNEVSLLCQLRDAWTLLTENPVDKDSVADRLLTMRHVFGRSLAARHSLPAGSCLQAGDVYFAKPAGGLPPEELGTVLGRTLNRKVKANSIFSPEDFAQ